MGLMIVSRQVMQEPRFPRYASTVPADFRRRERAQAAFRVHAIEHFLHVTPFTPPQAEPFSLRIFSRD